MKLRWIMFPEIRYKVLIPDDGRQNIHFRDRHPEPPYTDESETPHGVIVLDDEGDERFQLMGRWEEAQVDEVLRVCERAFANGYIAGKRALRMEMRKALGIAMSDVTEETP